ncbi:VOC family protein [Alphaproteobacteria bacterium]|jgi:hypothetical protein|nr:VOC family protein [Alphaproteobacteria bacterium]|tara:strand:+ start:2919 stop:3758 length:840 start_codon:yes stop_codon:yes gene_type:complete
MIENFKLDHLVINIKDEMDEAYKLFSQIGFLLTPRGFHSLGSINHSMMFTNDYLELIGFPKGGIVKRPELKTAPIGINGLVFKSNDIDNTYSHLCERKLNADPPRDFSRPVNVNNQVENAKFRTVNIRNDIFKAGRVYFCEHLTPELVWTNELKIHNNSCLEIKEIILIDNDIDTTVGNFLSLNSNIKIQQLKNSINLLTQDVILNLNSISNFKLRFNSIISNMTYRDSMFGAIVFKVKSLEFFNKLQNDKYINSSINKTNNKMQIFLKEYNCVLEFVI